MNLRYKHWLLHCANLLVAFTLNCFQRMHLVRFLFCYATHTQFKTENTLLRSFLKTIFCFWNFNTLLNWFSRLTHTLRVLLCAFSLIFLRKTHIHWYLFEMQDLKHSLINVKLAENKYSIKDHQRQRRAPLTDTCNKKPVQFYLYKCFISMAMSNF